MKSWLRAVIVFWVFSEGALVMASDNGARFSHMLHLIERHQIERISHLLSLLPESQLNIRVAAYRSRSLQCATGAAPRVIMFEASGSYYCSFNSGNPEDYENHENPKHCLHTLNHLECLVKNQKGEMIAQSLVFAPEIEYEKGQSRGDEIFERPPVRLIGKVAQYENPRVCAGCHYNSPSLHPLETSARIIFDQFFLWPGFYGSIGDNLYKGQSLEAPFEEQRMLIQYKKYQKGNPRYNVLKSNTSFGEPLNLLFLKSQFINNSRRIQLMLTQVERVERYFPVFRALLELDSRASQLDKWIFDLASLFEEQDRHKVAQRLNELVSEMRRDHYRHYQFALERHKRNIGSDAASWGRLKQESLLALGPANDYSLLIVASVRYILEEQGYFSYRLSGNFNNTFYFHSGVTANELGYRLLDHIKGLVNGALLTNP